MIESFKLSLALSGVRRYTREEVAAMLAAAPQWERDDMLCALGERGFVVEVEGHGKTARPAYLCNLSFAEGRYFGPGSSCPLVRHQLDSVRRYLGLPP